ncbi:MAG: hypothetical protein ACR2G3_04310 [Solirubrobacterales bacterium]
MCPLEKLNTHGGAIALPHPFGMTGLLGEAGWY